MLHEAVLRAEQDKPRARRGGKDAGSKNGAHTVHVVKRNIKGIVGGGVFTFDSHVGGYCFRQAEENQSVIDQMRRDGKHDLPAPLLNITHGSGFEASAVTVVSCFEPI